MDLVVATCGRLLGQELTGHENFFDVGGDSLVAVELVVIMEDEHGYELSLEAVFMSESINDLSKCARKLPQGARQSESPHPR